jgi:hypothetical protein
MKNICLALTMALTASLSWAAERYDVTESIDVSAPAGEVWDAVKGFDNLHGWHPAFSNTQILEGEPTLRGAIRQLTVGDNAGTVKETLTDYNNDEMSMSYVINSTDIAPVKDYASTIKVLSVSDELSLVIWSGNFLSNPKEGDSDESAREFIVGVYKTGLENLKKKLEK